MASPANLHVAFLNQTIWPPAAATASASVAWRSRIDDVGCLPQRAGYPFPHRKSPLFGKVGRPDVHHKQEPFLPGHDFRRMRQGRVFASHGALPATAERAAAALAGYISTTSLRLTGGITPDG
jgi:hypothetical protein